MGRCRIYFQGQGLCPQGHGDSAGQRRLLTIPVSVRVKSVVRSVSTFTLTPLPKAPMPPSFCGGAKRRPLGMATKPASPGFSHRIALPKCLEMGTKCQKEKHEGPDDTCGKTAPANRGGARVRVPLSEIVLADLMGHLGPVSIIRPRYRGIVPLQWTIFFIFKGF